MLNVIDMGLSWCLQSLSQTFWRTFCETLVGRGGNETLAQQKFAVRMRNTVTPVPLNHPYWGQPMQLLESGMWRA